MNASSTSALCVRCKNSPKYCSTTKSSEYCVDCAITVASLASPTPSTIAFSVAFTHANTSNVLNFAPSGGTNTISSISLSGAEQSHSVAAEATSSTTRPTQPSATPTWSAPPPRQFASSTSHRATTAVTPKQKDTDDDDDFIPDTRQRKKKKIQKKNLSSLATPNILAPSASPATARNARGTTRLIRCMCILSSARRAALVCGVSHACSQSCSQLLAAH
jgi:hypothetical protein